MILCHECHKPIELPHSTLRRIQSGYRLCDDCILLLDHVTDPTTTIPTAA